jgi:hypothetical protein
MSLRMFHLLFIALSVVLAAFFAAWASGQYLSSAGGAYLGAAIGGLTAAGALIAYAMRFQRTTRHL